MPAAYRDSLAQRFAQGGGQVPGAGQPVVRTSVPAHMTGSLGNPPVQNVRLVQSHLAGRTPGAAPGAPLTGSPNGIQQAGQRPGEMAGRPEQRGGEVQARPGMPQQIATQTQMSNQSRPLTGEASRPSNGVPRPPQANGGNPAAYAQQRGEAQQAGQPGQPGGENGRREPVWTQPHPPMAQQGQPGLHGEPHQQPEQQPEQQSQSGRPGVAPQRGAQADAGMPQRGVPRAAENPATQQQARQQEFHPQQMQMQPQQQRQPEQQAPRPADVQAQQPRQEYRPRPEQQARAEPRVEQRPQPMQMQPQPRPEPRPQMQEQPRPEPRPQVQQQPRPEPRPQVQQQPRPQQVQQPRPQPPQQQQQQHAEQHSGGGNRDERHKG